MMNKTTKPLIDRVNPNEKERNPKLTTNCGMPTEKILQNKLYAGPCGNIFAKMWEKTEPIIALTKITKNTNPKLLRIIIFIVFYLSLKLLVS